VSSLFHLAEHLTWAIIRVLLTKAIIQLKPPRRKRQNFFECLINSVQNNKTWVTVWLHTSGHRMVDCHGKRTEEAWKVISIHKNSAPLSVCNQLDLLLRGDHSSVCSTRTFQLLNAMKPLRDYPQQSIGSPWTLSITINKIERS
jgi:hypothetical protein